MYQCFDFLGHHYPVVEANIITQAGEETAYSFLSTLVNETCNAR
jgi:hypothetical protein